ncbi:hypothetical protein L1987_55170 [Smallanthus sonchifolius]|uniref:Uncharacterized protein n=1 Tax=Smallanthus sonchifolius TaxID=185202 RepID=A0ACB9E9U5_9ASTR|nr:hypothetical protein L1987_55170 [Smallanthus sonchifolius]
MERWGNARPAIGGTAVQHLEQNAQAFNQISANFAAFKLTYIYTHTYLSGRLAQNGLHPDCPDALPTPAQCMFEASVAPFSPTFSFFSFAFFICALLIWIVSAI